MKIFKFVLFTILTALITNLAGATTFNPKSKPITVVIPFAPGGGVDLTFRHLQKYADARGIELAPIYKAGADGLIGMNELAKSPTDGYHVSVGTMGTVAIHRLKNANSNIVAVTGIKESITAFVTPVGSSIKTIDDLDTLMKSGSSVNFGYGAPGQKMVLEELFYHSNAKLPQTMVPYKGGGPLVTDIVGGHVNFAALPLPIVKSYIDSGLLRIIAIDGRGKLNLYPGVPAITKKYPKYQNFDGFAFIIPGNTNSDAVEFWNKFLKEYVNDPQVQKEFYEDLNNPLPFGPGLAETMITNSMKKLKE